METILSIAIGVGLSAACGFRVFLPLFIMSIAGWSGHLRLAPDFQWISSFPALVTFTVASALEITAYYIPWLDHLLDSVATPVAIAAGTMITASVITEMSPYLRWSLALIAGGGAAGLLQGTSVMTRAASFVTTGGLANPLVATMEWLGALTASLLSLFAPFLVVACLVWFAVYMIVREWKKAGRPDVRQIWSRIFPTKAT
jgi:hypothetical protein